jgi:mercuric reductase
VKPDIESEKVMIGLRETVTEERKNKYENVLNFYSNITTLEGRAIFTGRNTLRVLSDHGEEDIRGYNIIIATGSRPSIPEIDGLEEAGYLTSDTIWSIDEIPGSLGLIGGGFIGLEIGQAFQRLGSHVSIIKKHDTIARGIEKEIGNELIRSLERDGVSFFTGRDVRKVYRNGSKKIIETEIGGKTEKIEVDEILIASGRVPNSDKLALENAGVESSEKGISVNSGYSTSNPAIYAAGDVIDQRYRLETLAAREGAIVASNIFEHQSKTVPMNEVPWAIFTDPQYASVGYSEHEYENNFGKTASVSLPLSMVPKARILKENEGVFKIVLDAETEKVVGIHVLAPYAAELIMEGVLAIKHGYTYNEIIENSHVFPTVAEGIKLAAQSFNRDMSKMSCCVE